MNEVVQIEEYLKQLKIQLEKFGIFSNQIILDNVKSQIFSVLEVWNDKETRNGILFFSMEIAKFYQPDFNIYLKSFVATAIRNSLIESAGSDFYQDLGFERQLKDEEIKQITSYAITYFKKFSFEKACQEMQTIDFSNSYLEIIKKYPLAWDIVRKMGNLKSLDMYFEPIVVEKEKMLKINPENVAKINDEGCVIEDGMTLSFNQTLCEMLEVAVTNPEIGFFSDSFKYVSRNFEKILMIIQYLLERNSKFVTFNYYFSNGYISQRKNLLKPSHSSEEIGKKLRQTRDISSKHKRSLELLKELSSVSD